MLALIWIVVTAHNKGNFVCGGDAREKKRLTRNQSQEVRQMPIAVIVLGVIGFILGIVTAISAPMMLIPAIGLILVGIGVALGGFLLMRIAKVMKPPK